MSTPATGRVQGWPMALSLLQADMASTIQQQQQGDRWAHPESEFKLKQQSLWPLQERERNACAESEIVHPTPRALSLWLH